MITLTVEGMTCMGCVASVKSALEKADPTAKVEVDLDSGRVDIDGALGEAAARDVIEGSGFDVKN